MDSHSETASIRRRLGGACLIVAPLFNWAAALVSPIGAETRTSDILAAVAAHPSRETASAMLDMTGTVLFVPAILAIVHLLAPRSPKLAHVAGALAIAGLFGFMAIHAWDAVQAQMVRGGADRDEMVALFDRVQESAPFALIGVLFLLCQVPGVILLSIGLFATRSAPRWVPPFIWAFAVWDVGLGVAGVDPQIAGAVDPHMMGFLGLAALGVLVLRQDDEDWQRGKPAGLIARSPGEASGPTPALPVETF